MTDAAVRITQAAVEQFTEQYLKSIGSAIEKHGERWDITVPEEADTDLPSGQFVLICADVSYKLNENEWELHPESQFFQDVVSEASKKQPTGKLEIASEETQIEIPPWLQESKVKVNDCTFTPYYDRSAIAILYRISIETVSEYQTELLHITAVDIRTKTRLPKLEKTFLESTLPTEPPSESHTVDIERTKADELIRHTREDIIERVQPVVNKIHQQASRAADAEVEEFRQMQQQRIEELEERKSRLSARIEDLNESIQESDDQKDRMQSLKKRQEFNSEFDEVESELEHLRHQREQGFPEKQRKIRNRHALEVVVSPLTITQIEYERGEIEFDLVEGSINRSLLLGYGDGIGITEDLNCDNCGKILTGQNPLGSIKEDKRCLQCHSS